MKPAAETREPAVVASAVTSGSSITRREALGTTAVVGAGLALPGAGASAAQAPPRRRRAADVLVVGAGFAGLAAAREVLRAGRSVQVLEARERVGGRVLNHSIGGGDVVEAGGQWIGPTQDRVEALAREVGLHTFPTFTEGKGLLLYEGRLATFDISGVVAIPPVPDGIGEAALALAELNRLAAGIDVQRPWASPNALEYDSETFETWTRRHVSTKGGRYLLDLSFTTVFATEPRDVSLLFALFYIAAGGNPQNQGTFDRVLAVHGGAQERRFVGGSQRLARRAARPLRGRIAFGAPARRIEQHRQGVRVVTDRGTFSGRRVVVAIPPTLAGRIDYQPALPALRDQLTQRMPMGMVIKVHAVYPEPFWREAGLAGYANTDREPVKLVFDNSPPDGRPGVLMGFIEADDARRWTRRPAAARRRAVLDLFADLFGERARSPGHYFEKAWAEDPWSRGCYGGFTPPGVLTAYGDTLRAPVRRIHWAGAETSDYWMGFMDGAIRSGERAAREVLRAL